MIKKRLTDGSRRESFRRYGTLNPFLISIILLIALSHFSNSLLIYEVYPNPIESETQGEYVVLYNENDFFHNLNNSVLSFNSNNLTLPDRNIPPKSYFMITDNNFLKDNDSWPDPDYETSLTIKNSDGRVELYENNILLDKEEWKTSKEGFSIRNNASSFPDPRDIESSYNINMITLNVYAQFTEINYEVEDDIEKEGIQWFYYENRNIDIDVETDCKDGYVIDWFGENKTNNFMLPNTRPGKYNFTIYSCGEKRVFEAEILPMIGIRMKNRDFDCRISSIKKECNFTENITNIGNVDILLKVENAPEHLTYSKPDVIMPLSTEEISFTYNGTNISSGNYTFNIRIIAEEK